MYVELTPEDTLRDLQTLLIDSLPGFEFPRIPLDDYTLQTIVKPASEITDEDFVCGPVWHELTLEEDEEEESKENPEVYVDQSTFNFELTSEEINIIAILMMVGWVQRQLTSVENTRMKYSGPDFKFTSQANHMAKLQSLLGECQRQSHHYQRLYKRREINEDNIYQSTWYWFGDHRVQH